MNNKSSDKCNTSLKKNDSVVVINGAFKGKRGKVLKIIKDSGHVVVEGINKRNKYIRPSQEHPQGGLINTEFPIHISNVMCFCDRCKKGVRIGVEVKEKSKSRICSKCGKSIDK
jgi:large subunit ribosomal protein L24